MYLHHGVNCDRCHLWEGRQYRNAAKTHLTRNNTRHESLAVEWARYTELGREAEILVALIPGLIRLILKVHLTPHTRVELRAHKEGTNPFLCTHIMHIARTVRKLVYTKQMGREKCVVVGTFCKSSAIYVTLKIKVILSPLRYAWTRSHGISCNVLRGQNFIPTTELRTSHEENCPSLQHGPALRHVPSSMCLPSVKNVASWKPGQKSARD